MPPIVLKRIYDPPAEDDGFRALVDRLWPRGVNKEGARLDAWWKDLAPSDALRKWFDHRVERFDAFRAKYEFELLARVDVAKQLTFDLPPRRLTLLYGAKDPLHNHAIVLRDFLRATFPR